MGKAQLIADVALKMRSLAESLQTLADAEKDESQPAKLTAKKQEVSLETVRGKLAELSQAGKTAEVREIIVKHGGQKLSDIKPEEYAAVLADAEVLKNAK